MVSSILEILIHFKNRPGRRLNRRDRLVHGQHWAKLREFSLERLTIAILKEI